ncbi:MAG: pantetheine-phosphate adenylyltransferase [Patescibacteria group bacterium]|nr:pantetheine-phosphate adenylyltransferase [Patescibacteria group bacterium]
MTFNLVAVAGTFDHLHLGHRQLLRAAKSQGQKIIIGLCRQSMLSKKPYPQSLEGYSTRRQALAQFRPDQIISLTDIYGPAVKSTSIEAIVCSPLSRPNVIKINHRRQKYNLKPLAIIEVPLVKADDGQRLASGRIRQGLINRQGLYYPDIFKRHLKLPLSLRPLLQRPFAPLVKNISRPRFGCIAVGDIAAVTLLNQTIAPDLAIVDLKTRRQPVFPDLKSLGLKPGLTAPNPAGTINRRAVKQLLRCLNQKLSSLLIDGEEDLLVLPTVLLAPLQTTVFYGQPNRGLVKIIVTETAKAKALKFVTLFT